MSDTIEAGSVVQLKSAGPKMTVSQVGKSGMSGTGPMQAWCDWFVQDKAPWKKESDVFPLTSLTSV